MNGAQRCEMHNRVVCRWVGWAWSACRVAVAILVKSDSARNFEEHGCHVPSLQRRLKSQTVVASGRQSWPVTLGSQSSDDVPLRVSLQRMKVPLLLGESPVRVHPDVGVFDHWWRHDRLHVPLSSVRIGQCAQ